MTKKWLTALLRWFFAVILIYASVGKILQPIEFALTIEAYQVAGAVASRWIAIGLPWLEFLTGLLLILPGSWRRIAADLNLAMMGMFLIAVGQAYLRDLVIDCGCFAGSSAAVDGWKLLQNSVLLLLSAYLFTTVQQPGTELSERIADF